jgi:hypothetical protein
LCARKKPATQQTWKAEAEARDIMGDVSDPEVLGDAPPAAADELKENTETAVGGKAEQEEEEEKEGAGAVKGDEEEEEEEKDLADAGTFPLRARRKRLVSELVETIEIEGENTREAKRARTARPKAKPAAAKKKTTYVHTIPSSFGLPSADMWHPPVHSIFLFFCLLFFSPAIVEVAHLFSLAPRLQPKRSATRPRGRRRGRRNAEFAERPAPRAAPRKTKSARNFRLLGSASAGGLPSCTISSP